MNAERKGSGVGWIGQVPCEWDVVSLRRVARLESGHTPSRNRPEFWLPNECTIPWFTLGDIWQLRGGIQKYVDETAEKISPRGMSNSSARLLPAGTVILSRTASVGFAGIMARPMATTQDFANWVCGPRISPDYLLWAFRAMKPDFDRLVMGSTHQTIYMPDIQKIRVPVPPYSTQRRIAKFLEDETGDIDDLIAEQQGLLGLLAEKRTSLIYRAVTRGFDSRGALKDSGVEWIGMVPVHWDVLRLKHVCRLETGHTPSRSKPEYWRPEDCTIPWVSLNDTKQLMSSDCISSTAHHISPLGMANSSAHLIEPGAVVFTRDATIGLSAITTAPMAVSQHIIAWVCGPRVFNHYLLRAIDAMRFELNRLTFGATIKTIGLGDIKEMRIPVPPRDEQARIVEYLAGQLERIDALSLEISRQITLLQERRQALITAAVTGQIDPT